jgi:membrane protein YdbS with pleckstrin-like domain
MSDDIQKAGDIQKSRSHSSKKDTFEERLLEGEQVVQTAYISQAIFWQSIAVVVLALIVGLFVAKQLGVLLFIVAVMMAGYAALRRSIYLLVLTNKRVFVRYGILQVDVVDIHFAKIESVELERMPTGYLMGYSNVVVTGTGNRHVVIPYVSNGPEIRRAYNELALADDKV